MTNKEKFKEVFGIEIDNKMPADPCDIFHHNICMNHECNEKCPARHFWDKEYKPPKRLGM